MFKKGIFCPFSPWVDDLTVMLASKAVFQEDEGTYDKYVLLSLPNSVHLKWASGLCVFGLCSSIIFEQLIYSGCPWPLSACTVRIIRNALIRN